VNGTRQRGGGQGGEEDFLIEERNLFTRLHHPLSLLHRKVSRHDDVQQITLKLRLISIILGGARSTDIGTSRNQVNSTLAGCV
jgi:hypothetical protein